MAASTFTEYYKLSQFQPEDTPNWLTNYNSDMEKIDNAMHGLSEQTEPLVEELATLTTRVEREEAQSKLQAEQIVSLQTSMDRNTAVTNDAIKQVNKLTGEVGSLGALVEGLTTDVTAQGAKIGTLEQGLADQVTINESQATDIAELKSGVSDLQSSLSDVSGQLQDFQNIVTTDWTPGPQLTGTLKMQTTWHNMRQLQLENALEFHDVAQLEHLTEGDWTSTGYILAYADGKVFNTHAPTGATEEPNTAENFVGRTAEDGLSYYWHYNVTANTTYLLVQTAATTTTGDTTKGNLVFMAD